MKLTHKFATVAVLGLGLAASAYAEPEQMGRGMGPQGSMRHGAMGEMQHGMKGGMEHGGMGAGAAGHGAAQQLMTPEERTAMQEKMRNAKTPEERQQLAAATHAEMQKRAKEKGVTLPEGRGPHFRAAPQAADTTEHAH